MGRYQPTDSIEFQKGLLEYATDKYGQERLKRIGHDPKEIASNARKKIKQFKKAKKSK